MVTDLQILDTTLRDGSYSVDFQFTADDTALIASALDSAGVRMIEVGHGLGLGASRAGKGEAAASDEDYVRSAVCVVSSARIGCFFIPGIGTKDDLVRAADNGLGFVRIGTDVIQSEGARPYVELSKRLGLRVSCNFMKSYTVSPEEFAVRAAHAREFGADVVCLVDSAGGMLPQEVRRYTEAALARTSVEMGFHGHDNLCLAMANTLEAFNAGARVLDASLQGIGRSEGNCVTEVLTIILQKRGLLEEMDVNGLLDIGEAFIAPLTHAGRRTALGITSGRARFHSSFLSTVMEVAARFGLDARRLILSLGEAGQLRVSRELLEEHARRLTEEPKAPARHVTLGPCVRPASQTLDAQVADLSRRLRAESRKSGLPSVLNVVVSEYEPTHVSPAVETAYGCVISNVMLADQELLTLVLRTCDGGVDYVLLDAAGSSVEGRLPSRTHILLYSDTAMWARAVTTHLVSLTEARLAHRTVLVIGVLPLVCRVAMTLSELGVSVVAPEGCGIQASEAVGDISIGPIEKLAPKADFVVALSPRKVCVDVPLVDAMRTDARLFDGGIGSLEPEAVARAEQRGIQVLRVDMRPTLASTALELIGMKRIVEQHMGRERWNGVPVVAGGLIGRAGDVVVDSVTCPNRVIGIADGRGGILPPDLNDADVRTVREIIALRLLKGR